MSNDRRVPIRPGETHLCGIEELYKKAGGERERGREMKRERERGGGGREEKKDFKERQRDRGGGGGENSKQ